MKKRILEVLGYILCILIGCFIGFKIADLGKTNNVNNTINNQIVYPE